MSLHMRLADCFLRSAFLLKKTPKFVHKINPAQDAPKFFMAGGPNDWCFLTFLDFPFCLI